MTIENEVEFVKKKLDELRIEKRRAHIPKKLWKEIISIAQRTSPGILANALEIDISNLRRHMKEAGVLLPLPNHKNPVHQSPFVKVNSTVTDTLGCLLEFSVNGMMIRVYR